LTHTETLKIMAILKVSYPEYYRGMKREQAESTVNLWAELLAPYPFGAVELAVKKLISESPYVPKISDVVSRVKGIIGADEPTANDEWQILLKAVKNANRFQYPLVNGGKTGAEMFAELPEAVRKFCGDISGLIAFGRMDECLLNSASRKADFERVWQTCKQRRETKAQREQMPPELRQEIAECAERLGFERRADALLLEAHTPKYDTPQEVTRRLTAERYGDIPDDADGDDTPISLPANVFGETVMKLRGRAAEVGKNAPKLRLVEPEPEYAPKMTDAEWERRREAGLRQLEAYALKQA